MAGQHLIAESLGRLPAKTLIQFVFGSLFWNQRPIQNPEPSRYFGRVKIVS
jgi:hypothetical protein